MGALCNTICRARTQARRILSSAMEAGQAKGRPPHAAIAAAGGYAIRTARTAESLERRLRCGPPGLRAGRLAGVRIQQHAQPGKGLLVVVPATADIADPGGEIRDQDKFLTQPGKVGDETQAHHAGLTFIAGKGTGGLFGHLSSRTLEPLRGGDRNADVIEHRPFRRRPIDQDGLANDVSVSGSRPQACESEESLRLSPRTNR